MDRPLQDVRVIALEQYAAGPYGSLHLADLGAEVIKIEAPPRGDVGRQVIPYCADDDSLFFESLNRNKRSVCLNVSHPEGRKVLEDLIRNADAVYSNLRGDVPARLGIRYEDLREVNPRIVCCSLSGYGMSGPRAALPGFDYMVQGLAGWMSITGDPGGPPTKTGLSVVDFSAGLVAALSMIVGIHAARRDGRGMDCDVSLFDTAISMLSYLGTWAGTAGYEPTRVTRSSHPTLVPFGNFPTSDGWIVAGGSKAKFWERLAAALGLEYLVDDPRFSSFQNRLDNRESLIEVLDGVFRTRTTEQWLAALAEAGVPCAPINNVATALNDPQAAARNLVVRVPHKVFGDVTQLRSPVRVGSELPTLHSAPALGEHTEEVLRGLLGYSAERVDELAALGVATGPGLAVPCAERVTFGS
jgi:crotonobetainyl-CoA:carnitine CoA-transferase CaiB-like acyl-CoA transferase